jgi:tetratricopeptide (TPR) repeat protein
MSGGPFFGRLTIGARRFRVRRRYASMPQRRRTDPPARSGVDTMPAPDSADSIAALRQRAAARPDDAATLAALGTALWQAGRRDEAMPHLARAVALDPSHPDARNNYGNALSATGEFSAAAEQYRAAIALRPESAELHYNLGNMLLMTERPDEAEPCLRAALARQPAHAGAHNNLGNALRAQGRHEAAIACYQAALALRPEYFGTSNNIGSALLALHRPAEAVAYFEAALAARPDYAEACNNLGGAMLALGRPADAAAWFARAVALEPGHIQARFGTALALLTQGDFRQGWPAYEARWDNPQFRADTPDFAAIRWTGEAGIAGRSILLHAEQGLGDTIQFARFSSGVRALGARVTLWVPAKLMTLLAPLADVIADQAAPPPDTDFHCPLMSLPLAFGTEADTIPPAPYLAADPARIAAWTARLGPRRRPRIGIAWSGSADHPEDALRSLRLADFLRPLHGRDAELHVLQTDLPAADAALLAASPGLADHRAELPDFAETAALIAAMDLVISVDTSVAHLAGALGAPVWVLLQAGADFRWLEHRGDTPWYPTMRLFRQTQPLDWAPVLDRIASALDDHLAGEDPIAWR